jgi:hypothetical protein
MVIKTESKYLTETNAGFCFVYGFFAFSLQGEKKIFMRKKKSWKIRDFVCSRK